MEERAEYKTKTLLFEYKQKQLSNELEIDGEKIDKEIDLYMLHAAIKGWKVVSVIHSDNPGVHVMVMMLFERKQNKNMIDKNDENI